MSNIKFDPCMKRMKISHIMRKYNVTQDEAQQLRTGNNIKDLPKVIKETPKEVPDTKTIKPKLNTYNKESK